MLVRRSVAIGTAIAMVAACSQDEHPRLVQPGDDSWWGFVANEVAAGEPFVLASEVRLCVDRPGRVEIVDVSLEHTAGGLAVDAFATDPMDVPLTEPEAASPTLWDYGFGTGPQLVGQQCTEDLELADQARLGVQFSKPTARTARGANLLIRYLSGGETRTLREEFELVLCEGDSGADEWVQECAHWPVERYPTSSTGG